MKKFTFLLSLLVLMVNMHAQTKLVLFRNDGQKDSVFFHREDFVRVKLKQGKSIHGRISKIGEDFFMVGADTIFPAQVEALSYKFKYPNQKGSSLITVGTVLSGVSAVLFISAFKNTNSMSRFFLEIAGGVVGGVGGISFIIAGAVKNRGVDRGKRTLGAHWALKIE